MKIRRTKIEQFTPNDVVLYNNETYREFKCGGPGTVVEEWFPSSQSPAPDFTVYKGLLKNGTPLVVGESETLILVVRREWRRFRRSAQGRRIHAFYSKMK